MSRFAVIAIVLLLSPLITASPGWADDQSIASALRLVREDVLAKRNLRQAIKSIDAVLIQLGPDGATEMLAEAHNLRTAAASYLQDWSKAEESARETLRLRSAQWPDGPNHALALGSLAGILAETGRETEAIDTLQRALGACPTPWLEPSQESTMKQAFGENGPARLHLSQCGLLSIFGWRRKLRAGRTSGNRRIRESRRGFQDRYSMPSGQRRRVRFCPFLAELAMGNLGSLYVDWPDRLELAEAALHEALTFRLQHADTGVAHTLNRLGRYYFRTGDLARSHEAFRLALEHWRAADGGNGNTKSDGVARGEVNLGLLLLGLGYQDRAHDHFVQSRAARPETSSILERSATYEALIGSELESGDEEPGRP